MSPAVSQGVAAPNTIVLSGATHRLVVGLPRCQDLGAQTVKGIATPVAMYQVLSESTVQHQLNAVLQAGLTPLVGREEELALLHRRWEQVKDREGQVVLLSEEPGIGKSRLVRELRNWVEQDNAIRIEFRCSPYYQNSALYPVIEHVQRLLQWRKRRSGPDQNRRTPSNVGSLSFPTGRHARLVCCSTALPSSS